MKIRIEKNLVAFRSICYDFSINRGRIYLAYFFKDSMKCRNWIYGENNKNIIGTQHKQSCYKDGRILRYIK